MSGRPSSIERLLSGHRRIAIDSNVIIYLLETDGPRAAAVATILDEVEAGRLDAVLSTVGLVEILTGPARLGEAAAFEAMADEIRSLQLEVVPLHTAIAEDAAWIRGRGGLDLGDAIHLATARAAGATAFVTNDRDIRSTIAIEVFYVDDLAA
jgi:predicted nucleic acid-binding protein